MSKVIEKLAVYRIVEKYGIPESLELDVYSDGKKRDDIPAVFNNMSSYMREYEYTDIEHCVVHLHPNEVAPQTLTFTEARQHNINAGVEENGI